METIRVKIEKKHTSETEIEVELPYFCKYGDYHYYMITSEFDAVQVFDGVDVASINCNVIAKTALHDGILSDEEEFFTHYVKALKIIAEKVVYKS